MIFTMPAAMPAAIEGRLVVAICPATNAIGKEGQLPWPHLRGDMSHFRALTTNGAVLMGPATFASLPAAYRPLPNRLNIVLSSRTRAALDLPPSVLLASSLDAAETLALAHAQSVVHVIGGGAVFRSALAVPRWSARLHITAVEGQYDGDVHFPTDLPSLRENFDLITVSDGHSDGDCSYSFHEYVRRTPPPVTATTTTTTPATATAVPSCERRADRAWGAPVRDERQYLDLVRDILTHGSRRGDRTGTGTLSVFGTRLRFCLETNFPLLTTKRVFFRGVAEELFWFLRGCTDAHQLSARGVRIWDANGSREFLDGRGLSQRREGDLGPVYGFQWRHFGADYTTADADYAGKGVDQIARVVHMLKTNPTDRRMIVSAWNPAALDDMALPPCHLLAQFYVRDGALSCQMYQRSADMGLGVPFNIASYALLTCLMAEVTGLRRGELVHVMGDTHVYLNHVEALQAQLEREPREFPKLHIKHRDEIDQFCFEDLTLDGYNPHGALAMKMAV